jgi:hypothetical protein
VVGDGLPAVSVHDLRVAADGSRIVAATHGRGMWQLELEEPPGEPPVVTLEGSATAFVGDVVSFEATASDPDGSDLEVRWLVSDDWRLIAGGSGPGSVRSELSRSFSAADDVLVGANAIDADGRMGFDSILVRVFEPGDDCSTPRVIPGDGPFPFTILTENRATTIGPDDPAVPCTVWPGDPDAGRWGSIWFEFTPAQAGIYIVTTCGSDPDTALSVWTGPACGPYEPVDGGCNDDDRFQTCRGRDIDSYLELDLAAGETVRVMLGATGDDETGDLRFTVDCPSCGPPDPLITEHVPAAARAAGYGDSFWTSKLALVNPGDATVATSIELVPGAGTEPAGTDRSIAPGEVLELADVIDELVGETGVGGLRLRSTEPLAVASRTSTTGDVGSYGQGIPSVADTDVAADGDAIRLFGFAGGPGFRTNLGLVNPGDDPVGLAIRFYNGETDELAETAVELEPGSWRQLNRVLDDLGIAGEAMLAVIRQTTRTGRFLGYASVVDDATDDPTYLGETGVGRVGDPLWIPAAAHATGIGGAKWRTDLTVCNPSTGDLNTRIALVGPDGVVDETILHLPEGWVMTLSDVVAERFGAEGGGALRLDPNLGVAMATSRTYADTPNGSYGQGIPGVAESDFVATGERVVLPGLRQDGGFRTNIGFVNAAASPLEAEIAAFAADGSTLGTSTHRIGGSSWRQLTQPLPRGTAFAVVSTTTPNARFFSYASVVDRVTDDPTYIAAVPADDEVLGLRY